MPARLQAFKLPLWKRLLDILVSGIALLVLSPFLIIILLLIRLESKGDVIYKSKRVGSNYHIFDFLKFRSMYTGADKHLKQFNEKNQYTSSDDLQVNTKSFEDILIDDRSLDDLIIGDDTLLVSDDCAVDEQSYLAKKNNQQENAFVKIEKDPRVTKVGAFMRKYSIDELPQLINILKGDMSIVGNRPLPLYEAEMLTEDDAIDRFMGPSGLTGLWQVERRGSVGKMSSEERKQLDIKYANEFSFAMDMKIIFKTFTAFIQKEDV